MMYLRCYAINIVIICILGFTEHLYAQTITSIKISNYQIQEAYLINFKKTVIGDTYKDACLMLDNCHWGGIPTTSDG
jgi:hypothetical protein